MMYKAINNIQPPQQQLQVNIQKNIKENATYFVYLVYDVKYAKIFI